MNVFQPVEPARTPMFAGGVNVREGRKFFGSACFGLVRNASDCLGLLRAGLCKTAKVARHLYSRWNPIFFKPLLASLDVSWSNFTSLFSDGGLTEPHLGSLRLAGGVRCRDPPSSKVLRR